MWGLFAFSISRTVIVCPVLPSPINGTVTLPEVRTPGSVAMYICSDGFLITGDDERVCNDSGMWNGTEPACIALGLCRYGMEQSQLA